MRVSFLLVRLQDKSLEKTNVKIDWNKFVDEDEEENAGEASCGAHYAFCFILDSNVFIHIEVCFMRQQ